MSAAASSASSSVERRPWRSGATIRWPERVRVHVHHRERVRRCARGRAPRRRRLAASAAEQAAVVASAPSVATPSMYVRAPARPEPLEASRVTSRVLGDLGREPVDEVVDARRRARAASLPRAFTPTVPCSTSSSPTTSTYGTFSSLGPADRGCRACRRARRASRRGSPRPAAGRRRRTRSRRGGRRPGAPRPAPARATPGTRPA